ncbi:MAG: YceI family protein [Bacteroidetes bacterium]|nr:YceI family protein [Bacteroidota bacterium]
MKTIAILLMAILIGPLSGLGQNGEKYITKTGHVNFFSATVYEDISADNYKAVSTINASTGEIVFSIPVKSFEFEKALMQKHFNQPNFMDSQKFPKIKFKGKIVDLSQVNFNQDGKYSVKVNGDLTIRGVTKNITEEGIIEIKDGKISSSSTFMVLSIWEFGIGKPKSKSKVNNVADDIKVTFTMNYHKSNS